jgi:hypothetical protein
MWIAMLAVAAVFAATVGFSAPAKAGILPTAPTIDFAPPNGVSGQPYDFKYDVEGIPNPTVSVTQGSLPPGLSMDEFGHITGTVQVPAGSYTFTVTATNGVPPDATVTSTIVIDRLPSISPLRLPAVNVGSLQMGLYDVAGGLPYPVTTITAGSLPPGMTLEASSGHVAGIVTTPGHYEWTVTATNRAGQASTQDSMDVYGPSGISGTPPVATAGSPYTFRYTLTGWPTPATALADGALPPGLSLGSDGTISGTPTKAGSYAFKVRTHNLDSFDDVTFPSGIDVQEPVGVSGPPPSPATAGTPYDFSFTLSGNPAPSTSVTDGALPPGLTLDTDGRLHGTPTTPGKYTFTVTADNGAGTAATTTCTIEVQQAAGISGSPPKGGVGEPYSFTFTLTGDPTPTVSLAAGHLPKGLSLSPSGTLSGKPKTAGTYHFTIAATNGVGASALRSEALTIQPRPRLKILNNNVKEGNRGKTPITFRITLNRASTVPVSVRWTTANGSAKAGQDFIAKKGKVTFAPGQTAKTITVLVKGDRKREPSEVFYVLTYQPTGATIAVRNATGGIRNDD